MSSRAKIKEALILKLKEINGTGIYLSNLYNNIIGKLKYWDEVKDFPYVCVVVEREDREYLPELKWGNLLVHLYIYVKGNDSDIEIEKIFTDIELLVDNNAELEYIPGKFTEDIQILSLMTDEGLLEPLRIGEILLQIKYGID